MAADEGLIDWDRPIREYEATFEMMDPTATREATLGDFLRHRSGFGEQRFLPRLAGISRDQLLQVLKYLEPEGEFRKRLVYSNLGYTVAGYLVGRSAGTSWEDFTRSRIFDPLEMSSTVFTIQEMEASGDYAIGYLNLFDFSHPERVGAGNLTTLAPAGGIVSNIEDMVKWLQFNLGDGTANGRRLVSAETLDFLQRPHTDLSSHPDDPMLTYQGYGYAWWTETYRGFRHVHHGGLGEGYISQVSYIPEEGIGVVVLTNTYYQHLYQALIYHIFDRLLGLPEMDHFDREYNGVKGFGEGWLADFNSFFDGEPSKPGPSVPLPALAGTYRNPAWGSMIVAEEEGRLGLTFDSGLHFTARHLDGDTFATERDTIGLLHRTVEFKVGREGRVEAVAIKLEAGTDPISFTREGAS
jgi:CubicO group peptidase (beta-lactamase class C family)